MSTLPYALRDSTTMFRRDMRHALRYPVMTISGLAVPIFMMLMFVYVFGNTMTAGLAHVSPGLEYIDYLAPAIVMMAVGSGTAGTAINLCTDMTEGIIDRFRTMAITRTAVLTGQVVGGVLRTAVASVLVLGVALLVGFRPTATPLEWLAAIGVVVMFAVALTWFAVACGLNAGSPGGANSTTMPVQFLLPFTSSAFVPTDSMPAWLRGFAEYQPFTAVIDTLRGLLLGTGIGVHGWLAVGWCALITAVSYLWARRTFTRRTAA